MEKIGLKQLMFAACSLACVLSVVSVEACEEKTPPRGQRSQPQGIARQLFPSRMTLEAAMERITLLEQQATNSKVYRQNTQARLADADTRVEIARTQAELAEQRATQAEQSLFLMKKEALKTNAKNQELEVDNIVALHCSHLINENKAFQERSRNDAQTIEQQAKNIEKLRFQKRANRQKDLARAEFMYEHGLTQNPPR